MWPLACLAGLLAAGGPPPSCEQPAGGLDGIRKQRLAGDLDAALAAARSTLECASTSDRQVELLVEIARIEDRVGLHENTRPVPEALAAIERADRIAERSGLRSKAAVELAKAEYSYRAELSGRELRSAERHAEAAAVMFQEVGDEHGHADAVHLLGLIHFQRGRSSPGRELEQAVELFEWSLALDRAGGERVWFLGEYHRHVGFVALAAGDSGSAVSHFEQSLACRREAGALDAALFAAQTLGSTLVRAGRAEEAREPLRYAWMAAERLDSPVGRAQVQTALGDMYRALGNRAAARDAYRRALDAAAKVGYRSSITAAEAALESLSGP